MDGVDRLNKLIINLQSDLTNIYNSVNDAEFLLMTKKEGDVRDREYLRGLVERGRNALRIIRRTIEDLRNIPAIRLDIDDEGGYIYLSNIPLAREESSTWRLLDGTPIGDSKEEAIEKLTAIFINNINYIPRISIEDIDI
jgi:hypothetical protein